MPHPHNLFNSRMHDTITLVTPIVKLGSYKPVYNFQYAKYNILCYYYYYLKNQYNYYFTVTITS